MESPDQSISTPPTSLAADEELSLPSIQFTNSKKLYQVIKQVSGDLLIVQNVPLAVFEQILLQERRGFRLRRYHADRKLLIITIPTEVHEALHLRLTQELEDQLRPTARKWRSIGSTTFRAQGHPGGDGGEGDSCGGPKPARNHKGAWPTLVIEAGVSETLPELRRDMQWWFSASDHQVKIVLLTKFDNLHQCIVIERWEEEIRPAAASTAVQPVLRQSITITRDPATDAYHVVRSDLVLPFRLLFLQDPSPQEGDLIISIAQLQAYARDVWAVV